MEEENNDNRIPQEEGKTLAINGLDTLLIINHTLSKLMVKLDLYRGELHLYQESEKEVNTKNGSCS